MRLISNPKWFSNPKQFKWSASVFEEKDIIIINKKTRENHIPNEPESILILFYNIKTVTIIT